MWNIIGSIRLPTPKANLLPLHSRRESPSSDKCGNTGLDRGKKGTVLGNGDADSVEACGESCGQKKGCKAVVYGYKESDYNRPYCKLLDGPQSILKRKDPIPRNISVINVS
ncbi:hypothetical protein FCULG_00010496 [Fusarium culmorum]|uniref:Apple domain-containing protein n=1 Tax=Fusarium culmorum TaxID=5516 RepID=A0A2T4GD60_FUSCU|nr:hypothetical protein FCULG_00010496 [Fusarium culmorum]